MTLEEILFYSVFVRQVLQYFSYLCWYIYFIQLFSCLGYRKRLGKLNLIKHVTVRSIPYSPVEYITNLLFIGKQS